MRSSSPPAASSGSMAASTSRRWAAGSPASARSGSRSSAATGRGAAGQPRAARSPDSASRALACAAARSAAGGPTTTGPGPNACTISASSIRRRRAALPASGSDSSTISRLPCTPTSTERPARPASTRSSGQPLGGRVRGRAADHHRAPPRPGPSPARRPGRPGRRRRRRRRRAAHHGVDDQRLEPGVPGAAGLGGAGVHGGGGEGDLAAEPQHALDQGASLGLVGGQRREVLLEHVGGDPDQLDGLAQAQPAGQVVRRDAERLGGEPDRLAALAEPGDEVGHPGLGDQQDAGPLVGRQPGEPGLALLHRGQAGGGQLAGGELQPPQRARRDHQRRGRCRRGPRIGAGPRHSGEHRTIARVPRTPPVVVEAPRATSAASPGLR